jgi:nicotinamide mononucleotide transporter
LTPTQILEIFGVLFTLANVYLLTKQNIYAWPCGLIGVSLYAIIFFQSKLYSDFGLHIIYVFLNIYGWWYWSGTTTESVTPVTKLTRSVQLTFALVILSSAYLWGYIMTTYTDASFAYADSFTTMASLVAQYLLARKKIENWIIWIIVDIVAIYLYLQKSLYPTAGLYLILLLLSAKGWREWYKSKSLYFEQVTIVQK